MSRRAFLATLLGLIAAVTAGASELRHRPPAPAPQFTFSGPYSHANLSIFLIHGPDATPHKKVVTLKEAMELKLVDVHETSNVNLLSIENRSTELEIFIMAGDVVKGGKQDRVIAFDLVVPPKSGKVALPSFCVESGRWRKRGAEDAGCFACSDNQVVGKGLKIAVNSARQQGEVWKEVEVAQKKLSDNVGRNVQSAASPTSLQLCLEDKDVQAKITAYEKALATTCEGKTNVIGIAVAVNGVVSSADVFGSANLCGKLWPKLLKSAATEALCELKADLKFKECNLEKLDAFFVAAAQGEKKDVPLVQAGNGAGRNQVEGQSLDNGSQQRSTPANPAAQSAGTPRQPASSAQPPPATTHYRVKIVQVTNTKTVLIEAHDNDHVGVVWHRCYIAK